MPSANFEEAKREVIAKLENWRSHPSRWSRFLHLDNETLALIKSLEPSQLFLLSTIMLLVLGTKKAFLFNAVYSLAMSCFLIWMGRLTWTQRLRIHDKTLNIFVTVFSVICFIWAFYSIINAILSVLPFREQKAQQGAPGDADHEHRR